MTQIAFTNEFTTIPGTSQPTVPVLAINNSRKFLQVANNSTTNGIVRVKFDQNFAVPANQVWAINFAATPTGGTWTVTDWTGAVSSSLTYNESSSSLSTALNLMAGFTAIGGVSVSGTMAGGFVITATDQVTASGLTNNGAMTIQSSLTNNVGQQSAIQNINWSAAPTAGTFKLQDSLGNQTAALAYNANAATIETALNALPAINNSVSNVTVGSSTIAVTFGTGSLENSPAPLLVVASNTLTNNGTLVNCVQTLYMEPAPLQGTFSLIFNDQTTVSLPYNATAAQIETAFTALSGVGAGNCVVTGLNFQSGFSFAFQGTLADQALPLIVVLNGPASQYGAVNGGTHTLQAEINPTNDVEKYVPLEISIVVDMAVPGVGPAPVTASVVTAQAGIAPAAVPATTNITTLGQAQVVDGISIGAGQDLVYDYAVPLGAMYIIANSAGISVQINEG